MWTAHDREVSADLGQQLANRTRTKIMKALDTALEAEVGDIDDDTSSDLANLAHWANPGGFLGAWLGGGRGFDCTLVKSWAPTRRDEGVQVRDGIADSVANFYADWPAICPAPAA
jgi:hypothetical protein